MIEIQHLIRRAMFKANEAIESHIAGTIVTDPAVCIEHRKNERVVVHRSGRRVSFRVLIGTA